MPRSLIVDTHASSCYFRTSVSGDSRKALVQITERCNLHCAHCFVSSTRVGNDMSLKDITTKVLPKLLQARVERVTLTGGEPFVHPDIMGICEAVTEAGMPLGLCTNATQTSDAQIERLVELGDVHVNISFDGFRPESHGKFRGNRGSFATTVETARAFAEAGLLQGLLSTPNSLTNPEEFTDLCEFAVELGARYVLMNPLSSFGRGIKSKGRMAAHTEKMNAIKAVTERFADQGDVERVLIRFPNEDKPLGGCDAGKLIYVFTDGQTAVCPYLVFAARNPISRYPDTDFLAGNVLTDDVPTLLDEHDFHSRFRVGDNPTCRGCGMNTTCGKGCPAAIVANGGRIGDIDTEQCPVVPEKARLLPVSVV